MPDFPPKKLGSLNRYQLEQRRLSIEAYLRKSENDYLQCVVHVVCVACAGVCVCGVGVCVCSGVCAVCNVLVCVVCWCVCGICGVLVCVMY